MHSNGICPLNRPTNACPENLLRFVQIDPFPRLWESLQLGDDNLRALENVIMVAPNGYPVVKGTDGVRKLRFSPSGAGRGKSGAYRIYYVDLAEYGTVLLMAIIAKKEQSDLTMADKNALAQVVGRLKKLLDQGVIQ